MHAAPRRSDHRRADVPAELLAVRIADHDSEHVDQPYNDCSGPIQPWYHRRNVLPRSRRRRSINCLTNGEASVAIKQAAAQGDDRDVAGRLFADLQHARQPQESDDRLRSPTTSRTSPASAASRDFFRETFDARWYHPITDDFIGLIHLQGGQINGFGGAAARHHQQLQSRADSGARLRAGRHRTARHREAPTTSRRRRSAARPISAPRRKSQFPIFGLPREIGLKGALFADAGTLFGYSGPDQLLEASSAISVLPGWRATALPDHPAELRQCLATTNVIRILGRREPDLGLADGADPLRLRLPAHQGQVRPDCRSFNFSGGATF